MRELWEERKTRGVDGAPHSCTHSHTPLSLPQQRISPPASSRRVQGLSPYEKVPSWPSVGLGTGSFLPSSGPSHTALARPPVRGVPSFGAQLFGEVLSKLLVALLLAKGGRHPLRARLSPEKGLWEAGEVLWRPAGHSLQEASRFLPSPRALLFGWGVPAALLRTDLSEQFFLRTDFTHRVLLLTRRPTSPPFTCP